MVMASAKGNPEIGIISTSTIPSSIFLLDLSTALSRTAVREISEPQYETDQYYATTGFATTIDEAAKKATRYMIDYLVEVRGMDRTEAYVLCSLAGDLKISEVVDVPLHTVRNRVHRGMAALRVALGVKDE